MPGKIDIAGKRFGRLVATTKAPSLHRHTYWECHCDCGKNIVVRTDALTRGPTVSCGCYQHDVVTRHGMWQTSIYHVWRSMLSRCENPNAQAYDRYGGRGITICERWHKFENFYADMGNRLSRQHSLDRIDNDGNYCPGNCQWATKKKQSRNRADNRWLTMGGETLCISEWAERTGIGWTTIMNRIKRGWTVFETLTTTPDLGNRWKRPITANGR